MHHPVRPAAVLALLACLALPWTVHATPVTYDLVFETSGQSLWDTGTSFKLEEKKFLGAAWQNQTTAIDLIVGDANTSVPNPLRAAYDLAFAACRALGFSSSVCINGQSARAPVPALGSRPTVRSCSRFAVACKIARAADVVRRAAYDVAFDACRKLGFSSSVCRNGQSGQVPVVALGTAPPSTLDLGDTRTGAAVTGTTDGRVGLELGVVVDSGSVDATLSYAATLELPDTTTLDKSNPISFNPQSALAGTSTFDTTFPTLALSVDAVMELSGSVDAEACLITLGCATGGTPFDIVEKAPVVSFNQDGEGGVLLLGRPPSDFFLPDKADGFPFELDVANLATVTLHLPQPNVAGTVDPTTGALKGNAQDDLVDLILDLDNIVATAAGVPGLFGSSVDIGGFGSAGFDIINVGMGPTVDLKQDFELEPTLWVELMFDQAVMVGGQVVNVLRSAWDLLPDITFLSDVTTVTPTFFLEAELQNRTLLDFDLAFLIDLLQITYDFGPIEGMFGIGNVLDKAVDLFESPDLYSKLFSLQGFNVAIGDSIVVDFVSGTQAPGQLAATKAINPIEVFVVPGVVPEPGTVLLLLAGLALVLCGSRRGRAGGGWSVARVARWPTVRA